MGKTFEAMQRAQREQQADRLQPVPYVQKPVEPFPRVSNLRPAPPWCQELWAKTQFDANSGRVKTILFTGVSQNAGCTTTVGCFAVYLASRIPARVLVLDMNSIDPCGMRRFFKEEERRFTVEILSTRSIQTAGSFESLKRNLVVVTNEGEPFDEVSSWLASDEFPEFLRQASGHFDFVLLDTAPVNLSLETRLLASKADGVVLLIEAGRSRRSVAQKAKQELEATGANILGSVISKRRFYIPNWLYSRL